VPTWAREAGRTIENEPLGTDYAAAIERAETVLLPAFDSWRTGGESDNAPVSAVAKAGTFDWLLATFRADRRFTKLEDPTSARERHAQGC
jgi:hypothetical protein